MNAKIAAFIALLSASSVAQTLTTYDTRNGVAQVASPYPACDIAITNVALNPDYHPMLRGVGVPALWDLSVGKGVTITGTIAQAEADLANVVSNQFPATVRLKGVDRSQYAESGRTNSNNGAAAMRVDLTKLFEMVAEINERLERLEAR